MRNFKVIKTGKIKKKIKEYLHKLKIKFFQCKMKE